MNLTHRLIQSHLVSGRLEPGEESALRIDQTLSQDATGTLSDLQFEATGVPRVRTQLSVSYVDPTFVTRVKEKGGGFLVAGQNYGQGSSREHAALCPMFFGVKAVLAKSFARIHRANLLNDAVLPLALLNEADYDLLAPEDQLEMSDLRQRLEDGATRIPVYNRTKNRTIETALELTERERQIVLAGGLLRYVGKETTHVYDSEHFSGPTW